MAYPLKMIPMAKLKPYEHNARTHPQDQIDQIKDLIRMAGFTSPVLYDFEADHMIAGHGRLIAALELAEAGEDIPGPGRKGTIPKGMLPCIDGSGMSEAERRAFVIADNQVAARSNWDAGLLSFEIGQIEGLGFDLQRLGFDANELQSFTARAGKTDPDDAPEPPADPVSVLGDVWTLGKHRLVCGDSTDATTVAACLNEVVPHLMVTDPPYGVNYDPMWREGLGRAMNGAEGTQRVASGKVVNRFRANATGLVDNDDRADWREAWALFPGDVAYVWHGGLHAAAVAESLASCKFEMRAQIIWAKQNQVFSRGDYHWQHEPCWYAVRKGSKGYYSGGRKQTTLWHIQNHNPMGGNRDEVQTGHGTQKPVECMKRPIENNSSAGQAVYEPFSGSGTTIIAGEMTGRCIHAIELSPAYVDVAVARWQQFTGQQATHAETGQTFAEIAAERGIA